MANENPTDKSFADTLYDEITAVIGGNNPNQFFCMGLPGTLIDPDEYSYDVGRILRTFKIKKNVEVTDNGKIII
ncbi:MAG: hypothetical protein J6D02_12225 [Lachnospira sp.]|nr:hypothetical protein [Lachnospira sp.]